MANKFAKGKFSPKNPEKYIGKKTPMFRSGWEMQIMMFFDNSPHILKWASESIIIQYFHPFKKQIASYIPDFFVTYRDKDSNIKAELIEVKPSSQTSIQEAKSKYDKLQCAINQAKWTAARAWCAKNKITFRILNETDIFRNGKK